MSKVTFESVEVGDIFFGCYGYNCTLPIWVKVVGKTPKMLKCIELEELVVGGSHNGYWYSNPSCNTKGRVKNCKFNDGYILFNDGYSRHLLHKWDGEPKHCNDMD